MSDEIKVPVAEYPAHDNLVLRHVGPMTGMHKTRSAKTTSEREAEKTAGKSRPTATGRWEWDRA